MKPWSQRSGGKWKEMKRVRRERPGPTNLGSGPGLGTGTGLRGSIIIARFLPVTNLIDELGVTCFRLGALSSRWWRAPPREKAKILERILRLEARRAELKLELQLLIAQSQEQEGGGDVYQNQSDQGTLQSRLERVY